MSCFGFSKRGTCEIRIYGTIAMIRSPTIFYLPIITWFWFSLIWVRICSHKTVQVNKRLHERRCKLYFIPCLHVSVVSWSFLILLMKMYIEIKHWRKHISLRGRFFNHYHRETIKNSQASYPATITLLVVTI